MFRAIPCNLLLWDCKSWDLRQTLLDALEVFLHQSVRRILRIKVRHVIEHRIKNERVREMFLTYRRFTTKLPLLNSLTFGKITRRESTHITTCLLTAWCDHPRKVGRPILRNKQCIVRNLQLVIPEVDNNGDLASSGFHALDASLWNTLLSTLKHPGNNPTESPPNISFTQTNYSPNSNGSHPPPPVSPQESTF